MARGATIGCKRKTNNEEAQTGKKGKEKVSDMEIQVVKRVCGICLSEEGKRTVSGALNCCSHYFCFACIMEWSKVESRCPLCKKRFRIINREIHSDGARELRHAVYDIPERDQVYKPSEEELRGYLDPYENVLCTECHLGDDEALMLLCDLCDSPAHTYCIGLGLDVPEGNWYCDVCRLAADISSDQQTLNPTLDHGTANIVALNSSPIPPSQETSDLNEAHIPDAPSTQVSGFSQSPRTLIGDCHPSIPSGHSALTLLEQRQIHRRVQQFLTSRGGRRLERNESPAHTSGINLFGAWISLSQPNVVVQPSIMPQNINLQRRLEYVSSSFCARQASSGGGGPVHHQLHPCTGRSSNNGTNVSVEAREGTLPSRSLQGPVDTHHF